MQPFQDRLQDAAKILAPLPKELLVDQEVDRFVLGREVWPDIEIDANAPHHDPVAEIAGEHVAHPWAWDEIVFAVVLFEKIRTILGVIEHAGTEHCRISRMPTVE